MRRQGFRDEEDDADYPNGGDEPRGAQAQAPFAPQVRSLDGGLAKACPNMEGLTQKTYWSFHRRLELFERQCHRRSLDATVEGALLMISRLNNLAWEASESSLGKQQCTALQQPFKPIYKVHDDIYQYQEEIEVPARCEEFFGEFARLKNEEMQAYLIRHKTTMAKMKEVEITIPSPLTGWHLLTRAAVPKWTHVQVKALCQGEFAYDRVQKP